MRRVALALVPLLLFACDREPVAPDTELAPTFAAVSEKYTDTYVLEAGDEFFYAPCINDNIDEIGTLYRYRHRVFQDGGVVLVQWRIWPGEDYVARGTTTGDWHAVSGFHVSIVTTLKVGFHRTQTLHWVVKNATTGVVLDWPIRYHVTVNAHGDVTIERYVEPCSVRRDK